VCVSGLGPCVVPTDDDGTPLRPAILYGIDSRAAAQIESLNDRYGVATDVARGTTRLSSQSAGPKLAWIRDVEPDVWSRTTRWFMTHNFISFLLTGKYVLDHPSASQCDPFYDLRARSWLDDMVADELPSVWMPSLVWPGDIIGAVVPAAAAVTGLAVGVPVVAGTIDAWS